MAKKYSNTMNRRKVKINDLYGTTTACKMIVNSGYLYRYSSIHRCDGLDTQILTGA